MNPTLKGIDQWPNTAPVIGAIDASYSATQEDRIISMKEPSENLKKLLEDLKRMTPEEMEALKLNLICQISTPSLAPSSPATPSESPERVETAEEAFDAWWARSEAHCRKQGFGWLNKIDCHFAFRAGYEAGRKAK